MFRRFCIAARRSARIQTRLITTGLQAPSEHKVILDHQTLFIDRALAKALGWKQEEGSDSGIQLSLRGWGPTYFTITPTGSESDRLARAVVESRLLTQLALAQCYRVSSPTTYQND